MLDFLHFWWQCILIGWHFGYGLFKYITGALLFVSTVLYLFKKRYRDKWGKWQEVIMKTAIYIVIASFIVATFLAPYLLQREREITIINTKKDIRTFLESISKEILQKIDARQTEIRVLFSIPEQIELKKLSERPDFSKFLDFKPTGDTCYSCGQLNGYISESNQRGEADGYRLYPKDALIK